ncbi:hypothetical protein ACFRR7_36740 [Streptomyces sp. NPDC056909]|uniref:hypothetical protein n=1 Tax=Streptomyces sp. NPDC056909 TaxID=3345963 RepID=UPI0036ADA54A
MTTAPRRALGAGPRPIPADRQPRTLGRTVADRAADDQLVPEPRPAAGPRPRRPLGDGSTGAGAGRTDDRPT